MPNTNRNIAYIETIDHSGDTITAVLTAHQADTFVTRAIRQGCSITPHLDGALIIQPPTAGITLTLTPRHSPKLTDQQAQDLEAINRLRHVTAKLATAGGQLRIHAATCSISSASTRLFLERGWVSARTLVDGAPVVVSIAGQVALTLHSYTGLMDGSWQSEDHRVAS